MVPFFRAVRGEKEESRSDQAERSEGATNWGQGSPEFGSFSLQSCPKYWNFLRNLVGMGSGSGRIERLQRFLISPPGGRAIKRGRSKNGLFGHFQGSLTLPRELRAGQRLPGVAADPWGVGGLVP